MNTIIKCETCLYNRNCQFLATHRNTAVEGCTAYKNAADVVSREVFEQVKWERDMALKILEEHGIGLGQKAPEVRCIDEDIKAAKIEAFKEFKHAVRTYFRLTFLRRKRYDKIFDEVEADLLKSLE